MPRTMEAMANPLVSPFRWTGSLVGHAHVVPAVTALPCCGPLSVSGTPERVPCARASGPPMLARRRVENRPHRSTVGIRACGWRCNRPRMCLKNRLVRLGECQTERYVARVWINGPAAPAQGARHLGLREGNDGRDLPIL